MYSLSPDPVTNTVDVYVRTVEVSCAVDYLCKRPRKRWSQSYYSNRRNASEAGAGGGHDVEAPTGRRKDAIGILFQGSKDGDTTLVRRPIGECLTLVVSSARPASVACPSHLSLYRNPLVLVPRNLSQLTRSAFKE